MRPSRDRILAAAERVHRKEGTGGLSIRRIADMVGLTPMAIYRHYRDKDALIEALVAAGFARWEKYLERAVAASDPVERIRATLRAYLEFALAEPRYFELMFLTPRGPVPEAPASLQTTPSPSFTIVIASVREALAAGRIRAADPGEFLLFAWAQAHGIVALHLTGRFGGDAEKARHVLARAVDTLFALHSAPATNSGDST